MRNQLTADFSWNQIDDEAVRFSRGLAIDAIENAGSGHPGASLSLTPLAYLIYEKLLVHSPANPNWFGRDRLILSCGHASVIQYVQLFLSGNDVSIDDLKNFRKIGSKTPGHPEKNLEIGIEVNTGPLGQGFAMAVGMALASRFTKSAFFKEEGELSKLFSNYIYVIASDGDLQEGITSEASSIAGTNQLGNLIVFYDSNGISIDGEIGITFSEDVSMRYKSYNWNVINIPKATNGDLDARKILESVKMAQEQNRPTIIILESIIGWPAPNLSGTSKIHGNLLGEEESKNTKKELGLKLDKTFYVSDEVLEHTRKRQIRGLDYEKHWIRVLSQWKIDNPQEAEFFDSVIKNRDLEIDLSDQPFGNIEAISLRKANRVILDILKNTYFNLFGGSADLTESNGLSLDNLYSSKEIQKNSNGTNANNFAFGVREHAMAAIINGMSAYGFTYSYCATYLVFSDYQKAAIRLSAMMRLFVTYIWTHDSVAVGADGPTHQPVEHLAMLRSIPNFAVIRPADANELVFAWKEILRRKMPTGLVLARQELPIIRQTSDKYEKFAQGGYVVADSFVVEAPDIILISTGSELQIAIECYEKLNSSSLGVRVVSMPCTLWFDQQSAQYRESVLPNSCKKRIVIEAASSFGWGKYLGIDGKYLCIDNFGESGDGNSLLHKFGITVENCIAVVEEICST